MATTLVGLALVGAGCGGPRAGASGSDPVDAAVTFQSAVVTNPATWNSLWGSWPSDRFDHSMAYDSDLKRIVVFGGRDAASGPHFNELWEFDTTRGSWNQRTPAGAANALPYDRSGAPMVYDTVRKKTVMFGGWQPGAGFIHPEWWDWDGTTQAWTKHLLTTTDPTPRFNASMVWDSGRNRIVLFGGIDETTGRLQDTWEFDGTAWTNRTPAGMKPTPRHSARMAYDSARGRTVLYAGNTGSGVGVVAATGGTFVDETWEWDGAAGTWTRIAVTSPTSTMWNAYYCRMAYDASVSKLIVKYDWNQVWEYDPVTPAWKAVMPAPTKADTTYSPPYNDAPVVYDSGRQRLVTFGGISGYRRQLWELNSADFSWVNRSIPVSGPIQRQYPSIAFNSKSGTLLVFGGYSSLDSTYKQDIWEWSGTGSALLNRTTGGTKPPPRNQGAMVYDSQRDRLLLFGGYNNSTGSLDDIWAWDPTTSEWSQVTLTGARPSSRYGSWAFYDAVRDKVYLVGYSQAVAYQVWEYDPALNKWLDRSDSTPPTGVSRSYFDVGFDSNRGKVVMIGGSGTVYNTDIWEWDTTTAEWAQLMPAATSEIPDGRYYHTLAYDPVRRVMLMVGGHVSVTGKNTVVNDSWEWDANLLKWSETTPPGVKPLPRENHLMVFNSMRGSTYLFGGSVPSDTTYGPSEFWEYLPNAAARPNGAGCTAATAANCMSGNCVDGVCCAQTAAQCNGMCRSCNVTGSAGTCANVPVGLPDDTCPSDQACDAAQQCKKRQGQACNLFSECASGNCADGVCCNTACNDRCKQCNLVSARGTCSFVPSGDEDPVGVPACVSEPDQGRQCDGAGNCSNTPKPNGRPCTAGAQCTSGNCIDGYCCNSTCITACYQCNKPGALGSCSVIAAGQQDFSASNPCDLSTEYCTGSGTCAMNKKPNGQTCTASTECGSNNCVDGICCSGLCTSTCQSCAVPGSIGNCVNLPAGAQDTNATVPCSGSSYCDAAGTCQSGLKPNGNVCTANAECGSAKCVDGVCCNATCTEACYTCNLPGGTPGECAGLPSGSTDPACTGANYCDAMHRCTSGKKSNGATCTSDLECASNACVDGTCCESACQGKCRSCKNATGTCTLVANGMDPRMDCSGEGDCKGTCDGQGACRWAAQGTVCAQAGCQQTTGIITGAGSCDGAGHCIAAQVRSCNGFRCYTDPQGMAQCGTDCSRDPECALDFFCQSMNDGGAAGGAGGGDGGTGSQCPPVFDLGHACTRNSQCGSGTCSDGVCCNVNCDKCGACNLPSSLGTCVPIPAGTDPEGECMDSASDPTGLCKGFCSGQPRCTYPAAGTKCGMCKACNGSGLCSQTPQDDSACGTIDCDGLNTNCLDYEDLTTNRCGALGLCKAPNTAASCPMPPNTCTGTGGSAGGRGGAGGSTGAGGSAGAGGSTGTAGSTGGSGRGGTTGTAGSGRGGGAGATGTGTGGATAGAGGGGGGGCCAIGGNQAPNGIVALLLFASVMITRRRRR